MAFSPIQFRVLPKSIRAELFGGPIGLLLLFHMPLLAGMVVAGAATYSILMFEVFGLPHAGVELLFAIELPSF
jgi:hypothetical protein